MEVTVHNTGMLSKRKLDFGCAAVFFVGIAPVRRRPPSALLSVRSFSGLKLLPNHSEVWGNGTRARVAATATHQENWGLAKTYSKLSPIYLQYACFSKECFAISHCKFDRITFPVLCFIFPHRADQNNSGVRHDATNNQAESSPLVAEPDAGYVSVVVTATEKFKLYQI